MITTKKTKMNCSNRWMKRTLKMMKMTLDSQFINNKMMRRMVRMMNSLMPNPIAKRMRK